MASEKPVHTVILDAGPIIRGDPSVSSLLAQSEQIVTLSSVIKEIKDEATRIRLQTTLVPFLVFKTPKQESIKIISEFARKTGDLPVLSRVDIQLLALAYDLECERNGGDWRLRKAPGEKRINGPNPMSKTDDTEATVPDITEGDAETKQEQTSTILPSEEDDNQEIEPAVKKTAQPSQEKVIFLPAQSMSYAQRAKTAASSDAVDSYAKSPLPQNITEQETPASQELSMPMSELQVSEPTEVDASSDSDSDGWITPSNLKEKQNEHAGGNIKSAPEPKTLQVALITSDFAMQNVALQMNLNVLSGAMHRVRNIKTTVLRCHACFKVERDTSKRFCARCGMADTLTRVSCSTNEKGEFTLHLKKNMQWNKRGHIFSVPKPVHGSSNGRIKGGGKGGWGNGLIFAEDQKEYVRAKEAEGRQRARDLMDEDYLPSILTGDRVNSGGGIKVGAGRTVNSRKR